MRPKRVFIPAILAFAICAAAAACGSSNASDIRPPAVAGQFYPDDSAKLKLAIEKFLQEARPYILEKPVAIIVPHAGYVYSGQICADAYRQVKGKKYDTVVILGVNHTTRNFTGVSIGNYDAMRTPLGSVAVDEEIASALISESKDCVRSREVHDNEHSIEVQIPFIQVLFPEAKIVPIVIHPPDYELCVRFGEALGSVLKNRQALIVISSDLSHYPSAVDASKIDRLTLNTIATLDTVRISSMMRQLNSPNLDTRACGEAAMLAGITAARILGAKNAVITGYANSADLPMGEKSRTVGYGAVVLTSGEAPKNRAFPSYPAPPHAATPLQSTDKKALLAFARETLNRYLTTGTVPLPRDLPARASFPQGAFVTLKKNGELRGCIGQITPDGALGRTVGSMALHAALNDPRFQSVQAKELNSLEIEISVLTPLQPVSAPEEIVVGRDGVVLSKGGNSAVFLPQVAPENGWNRAEMLDHLCEKGGMPAGCWKRDAKFQTFQAEVFSESQFR